MIYVDDVDKIYPQAIAAGGKEVRPLRNQFYGDRSGTLTDPFGHVWTISTHVEGRFRRRSLRSGPRPP